MHVLGWWSRHWSRVWGVFGVGDGDTRGTPLALCWCLYCQVWVWLVPCSSVYVVGSGQVNADWVLVILITRVLLTNNVFTDSFIVIFCSIRFFFKVNIINCSNYLIYIMKLQVLMVLWSVLKSPLVLGWRFVATSQFICIVVWQAGFCMVQVFGWWRFWNIF